MEKQIEADARAGASRAFASPDEARQFLLSLTPAGFRPRPEFFGALADAGETASLAARMASYAQSHPAEVQGRLEAFSARLQPLLEQVSTNVKKRFPEGL
jgi:hypothetical protein